jgi:microsomal dipeptidase-like Zn-dependent dipeptidase
MILDWHAHYPMQVVENLSPASAVERMRQVGGRQTLGDRQRALLLKLLSRLFSDKDWWSGYRITIAGVRKSDVGVLLSVLFRPFDEMDLSKRYAAPPAPGYFSNLIEDLEAVEADIAARDPATIRVAHDRRELERCLADGATALVHCVEGGFHLGGDPDEIEANCVELARRGVAYVTVAHLFFRQIATNANAIPFVPDRLYDAVFPQDERHLLTLLGEALIRGLVRNRILADLSHMAPPAIHAVLRRLDELDPDRALPVISTHAGYRFGRQRYMHDRATLEAIARRNGVVGLIMAQHQLNDGVRRRRTTTLEQSLEVIFKHVDAIASATGGYEHIAIGTDFDGFIKPTMAGLEGSGDLWQLEQALERRYDADTAELITSGNSLRVLRQLWPQRAEAPT